MPAEPRYRPQLDSLRACAVTIVMLHHYLTRPFILSGFGVMLFFVLSGYFATRLLLKLRLRIENDELPAGAAFGHFYLGRGLRIFPLYYLVLFVTALCNLPYARDMLPWNGLFTANFAMLRLDEWPGRFSHFWSLSVLEQFYVAWPLLILFCRRKWLLPLTLAIVAVAPVYRMICWHLDLGSIAWCVSPFAVFDQLGCGALLAICCAERTPGPALQRLLALGGPICGPLFAALLATRFWGVSVPALNTYLPTVAALFFVWLVHRALTGIGGPIGAVLNNRLLARIGTMSYSIYLLHNFTELMLPDPPIYYRIMATDWRAVILIPGTLFFAYLSWRFLEMPLRGFRDVLLAKLPAGRLVPVAKPVPLP